MSATSSGRTAPAARRGRGQRLLALVTALGLLAGCGSATATRSAPTPPARGATRGSSAGAARTAATAHRQAKAGATAAAPPPSTACAATVAGALGTVAARVYREAATGSIVAQAVHRLQSSSALKSAVNAGDATATGAALRKLTLGQIVRVQILRGGRVLAQTGSGSAIAPARAAIPGTSATFVLSTQSAQSYLRVVHQVTGAQVVLTTGSAGGTGGARRLAGTIGGPPPASLPAEGPVTYAGQTFQTTTLTGATYPAGALHIVLLAPTAGVSCPGSAAQTRVETLGHVGELIYQEELHSPDASATLRHVERSPAFTRAVAARDPAATRAAIVGFFREHIHVVRVRVNTGAGLLVDVGGPYVLAPVHGAVHSGGRVVGRFELAIQDDAGYLRLAHLFTGAEILMRTSGSHQVMGTLSPGPAAVPDHGPVSYGGRAYEAYSFTGEAFPSGPLRLSLLLGS